MRIIFYLPSYKGSISKLLSFLRFLVNFTPRLLYAGTHRRLGGWYRWYGPFEEQLATFAVKHLYGVVGLFVGSIFVSMESKQNSLVVTTAPLNVGNKLKLHAYFNWYVLLCRTVLEITAASLIHPSWRHMEETTCSFTNCLLRMCRTERKYSIPVHPWHYGPLLDPGLLQKTPPFFSVFIPVIPMICAVSLRTTSFHLF